MNPLKKSCVISTQNRKYKIEYASSEKLNNKKSLTNKGTIVFSKKMRLQSRRMKFLKNK